MDAHFMSDPMADLFWIPVADRLLTPLQRRHAECQPFFFAVELLPDRLSCELLVRTRNRVRCDCIAYATVAQREWLFNRVDAMFQALEILT
jgi:hypothetical protein